MNGQHLKDDSRLIEACLKKDIAAWRRLVNKYSGLVYISIENRLKKCGISASRHDMEDIKQDIFADIWKNNKLKSVINRGDISYWISILSGNAAIEYFRRKDTTQLRRTVSLSDEIAGRELSDILPSGAPDPKSEFAKAEVSDRIDEAIEELPSKEKLIIKLHLIRGKKHHDIAAILDMPEGTVSSHVRRAKEKLKKRLKDFT